jgi:hypothetical protein
MHVRRKPPTNTILFFRLLLGSIPRSPFLRGFRSRLRSGAGLLSDPAEGVASGGAAVLPAYTPDQLHLASYFPYEDLCPKQIFIWHEPVQEALRGSPNLR